MKFSRQAIKNWSRINVLGQFLEYLSIRDTAFLTFCRLGGFNSIPLERIFKQGEHPF